VASDQGPAVQSALLRNELVRLRRESGLTQQQVAQALEWSPSKLIRIEGGASSITKVDLDALLARYGITSESRRERLQALNRGARERAWWDSYRDDISPQYLNYVGFETGASAIRQFQIGYIPGLLQTPEYSEAATVIGRVDPAKVERIATFRVRRQQELQQRSHPPRQYFVLDEAVIRRHVGIDKDRTVMPRQLRDISDRAEREELLTVRVIPFEAGGYPGGVHGTFTLMSFEEGLPDVLFLDADQGVFTMIGGNDPRVANHSEHFEDLLQAALSAAESAELIRRVATSMSLAVPSHLSQNSR
jgi:transcriptional regulator with XRE-family HTH domain